MGESEYSCLLILIVLNIMCRDCLPELIEVASNKKSKKQDRLELLYRELASYYIQIRNMREGFTYVADDHVWGHLD